MLGAARDVYPHHVSDLPEIQTDRDGNFARAANRWIRRLARALPVDARVVVAVDDFDEPTRPPRGRAAGRQPVPVPALTRRRALVEPHRGGQRGAPLHHPGAGAQTKPGRPGVGGQLCLS
nr:hypothetical protein [Angustibacter aerolatus]